MSRAPFIVFEGADRSGKTTQTRRYVSHLRQKGVTVAEGVPWRFPDRTTGVGKMINAYLKGETDLDDHMLHLLFSANRWEKAEIIKEKLSSGETIVVDRYAYSGVAYSVAKGLPIDWCRAPDAGLPAPDVVIYLDLSPIAARDRGDYGDERYENLEMQRAVSETFVKLRTKKWVIVDANADEETVFARVLSAIDQVIGETNLSEEIETLW